MGVIWSQSANLPIPLGTLASLPFSFISPVTNSPPSPQKSLFPQYDTVCRVVQGNAKAKVWYALSDTLLLPEYLVEFEYTTANGGTFGPKVTQRDQEYLQVWFSRGSCIVVGSCTVRSRCIERCTLKKHRHGTALTSPLLA